MEYWTIINILPLIFYIVPIVSGYIIKKNLNELLDTIGSLKVEQIKILKNIVNVAYYTMVITLLTVVLLPYINMLIRFLA